MNMFRHWVMWSAVEVAPGKYDWRDYDRMLDLEGQNGIKAVLAEQITAAPEWAFRMFPNARFEAQDGYRGVPEYSGSSATGGFPACVSIMRTCVRGPKPSSRRWQPAIGITRRSTVTICGTKATRAAARACTSKPHQAHTSQTSIEEPALGRMYCYCPASIAEFHKWLAKKYGSVEAVAKAWRRYQFCRLERRPAFPDRRPLSGLARLGGVQRRSRARTSAVAQRSDPVSRHEEQDHDARHRLHAGIAAQRFANDWRAAAEVDSYGFTWVNASQRQRALEAIPRG